VLLLGLISALKPVEFKRSRFRTMRRDNQSSSFPSISSVDRFSLQFAEHSVSRRQSTASFLDKGLEPQIIKLIRSLNLDPSLAPLLKVFLPHLALSETDMSASYSREGRVHAAIEFLATLISACSQSQPFLFLIDDLQWYVRLHICLCELHSFSNFST
jgi:hypothetical protein